VENYNLGYECSVVVPVFRGEKNLPILVENVVCELGKIYSRFEIILVDDFSPDDSWRVIEELVAKHSGIVRGYRHARSFGQPGATLCGLSQAEGSVIITMDDDLEHDPREIPKLIQAQKITNSNIVIARFQEKTHRPLRKPLSFLNRYLAQKAIGFPRGLYLSAFRIMKKEIAEEMIKIHSAYPYLPALMFSITHRVTNVDVAHGRRVHGESNYSLWSTMKLGSRLLINHSSILLDVVGVMGLVSASLSFLIIVGVLLNKLLLGGAGVSGWTSLIVSIYLIGGVVLFSIGIIGKYLVRIIGEASGKPRFFVSEKAD